MDFCFAVAIACPLPFHDYSMERTVYVVWVWVTFHNITNFFDQDLYAYVESGAARQRGICFSGSIKGCLMFVQKLFYLDFRFLGAGLTMLGRVQWVWREWARVFSEGANQSLCFRMIVQWGIG